MQYVVRGINTLWLLLFWDVYNARGIFTYVNAGQPGSIGDSYTYRHSILSEKLGNGEWLKHSPKGIEGCNVRPFLVADVAFALASKMRKCYDDSTALDPFKRSFN